MGTTQPIRKEDELYSFRMYYADEKPNVRNYTLIVLGGKRIYFHENNLSRKTAQPLAGIPDRQNCRSSHHTRRLHQLSFPQKNIWLPCMETGNSASTFNGYL